MKYQIYVMLIECDIKLKRISNNGYQIKSRFKQCDNKLKRRSTMKNQISVSFNNMISD